jgi:hypothetical protein
MIKNIESYYQIYISAKKGRGRGGGGGGRGGGGGGGGGAGVEGFIATVHK